MWSRVLFRYIIALIVIAVLSGVLVNKLISNGQPWEHISGQGLAIKMETTLEQIYWQWQGEGRPDNLMYEKSSDKPALKLAMTNTGIPIFESGEKGCRQLLELVIGEDYPVERLGISLRLVSLQPLPKTRDGLKDLKLNPFKGDINSSENALLCKFEYAGRIYFYQLNSGDLTIY